MIIIDSYHRHRYLNAIKIKKKRQSLLGYTVYLH